MSDRIAVMGNGQIEQVGNRKKFLEKPNSSYVASFLGINTFDGKAVKSCGDFLEIEVEGE